VECLINFLYENNYRDEDGDNIYRDGDDDMSEGIRRGKHLRGWDVDNLTRKQWRGGCQSLLVKCAWRSAAVVV